LFVNVQSLEHLEQYVEWEVYYFLEAACITAVVFNLRSPYWCHRGARYIAGDIGRGGATRRLGGNSPGDWGEYE